MKNCPYCTEEVRDKALKCSCCGKNLDKYIVLDDRLTARNMGCLLKRTRRKHFYSRSLFKLLSFVAGGLLSLIVIITIAIAILVPDNLATTELSLHSGSENILTIHEGEEE